MSRILFDVHLDAVYLHILSVKDELSDQTGDEVFVKLLFTSQPTNACIHKIGTYSIHVCVKSKIKTVCNTILTSWEKRLPECHFR